MRIYNDRVLGLPKPSRAVLMALAVLFAAGMVLYTFTWMYYIRWQPHIAPSGISYLESPSSGALQITRVEEGSAAAEAGLRAGDRVTAIKGRPMSSLDPFFNLVSRGNAADRIDFTFDRDGIAGPSQATLVLRPPVQASDEISRSSTIARELANSYPVLFLVVGLYVLFVRLEDQHAWLLAMLFAAFIAGPAYERIWPVLHPAIRPYAMAYALIWAYTGPALFYAFFSTFPDSSPFERRAPWLKWGVAAVCSVVAVPAAIAALLQGRSYPFYVQWGWLSGSGYSWLVRLVLLGFVALGFSALFANAFEEKDPQARRRFRVILWGTVVGFGPEIVRLAGAAGGISAALNPWVQLACLALLMLVPSSMAYAVVKHRVMEIPLLLKRSARYLVVRRGLDLALAGFLAWVVYVLSTAAQGFAQGWRGATGRLTSEAAASSAEGTLTALIFLLGLTLGAFLVGTHRRVRQHYVQRLDRAFFRSVYDTKQILQHLAENIPLASSRNELAGMLEMQLLEALHPESLAVYLRDTEGRLVLERFTPGPVPAALESLATDSPVLLELAHRGRPWEVPPSGAATPPNLPQLGMLRDVLDGRAAPPNRSDVLAQLVPLRPECLVPVMGREHRMAGLLVLGERLSEESYSDEDEKLLALVAGQAGVAFENIHLAEQIASRLQAEQKRANEMSIAREVQSKLFPQKKPPLTTLDYAGSCDQARTIGGDYYDYLDLGKGRVGLVLADISGKGIFAALLMANLQANLRSQYAMALEDLGELMRSVNRLFFESVTSGLYATLFIADYSDDGRRLRYVNCGHNPPLLLRASGACEKLDATATVLGLMDVWDCTVGEVTLAPGDVLVVYSDGVTEASSDAGDFFGDHRLEGAVRQHQHLSAAELTRTIAATVHAFSGKEQEDDLTLLVARARA